MNYPAFNSGSSLGTWDKCNAYCPTSYSGATMLCVRTETENKWIKGKSGQEIWIGYTDKGTQKYGWVKGCSSTYTNWNTNEPNNAGGKDYAYIFGSGKWKVGSATNNNYCGCQYTLVLTTAPTYSPSTRAPTTGRPSTVAPTTGRPSTVAPTTARPSTVAPTTSSPSTVAPTTAVPSTLVPTEVELPECPDGWTLHCNCEFTYGPEKNNIEHSVVSVDTNAKVSSNDADIGYNQFFMGIFVGAIGSLSMIAILYLLYTRSEKDINHRSEYIPINDRESG